MLATGLTAKDAKELNHDGMTDTTKRRERQFSLVERQ
jgi:hypothetical protein